MVKEKGVIGEIRIDNMEGLLNGTLEECIARNESVMNKKGNMRNPSKSAAELIMTVDLNDFIFLKKIGEGQFGTVFVIKEKTTGKLYALKAISISQVNDDGLEKHIIVRCRNAVRERCALTYQGMSPSS